MSSVHNISVTYSEKKLMETDEYQNYKNELLSKLGTEYDFFEITELLKKKKNELTRIMRSRARKEKVLISSKIKTTEKLKIVSKSKYQCFFSDLPFEEKEYFTYNNYVMLIPTINYLSNKFDSLLPNDYEHYIINAYFSLDIEGKTLLTAITRKIRLYNNNKLKEELDNELIKIIERAPNYEDENKIIKVVKLKITITLSEWNSILNWWPNFNTNVIKRKFLDFEIFTAPNQSISCIRQCVEKLGGIWNENAEIIDMIPQKKIIYYVPIQESMDNVNTLADLASDYDDEVNSNDCKNIARLIKFDGHMALITSIKYKNYKTKIQSKKIMNYTDTNDYTEVFMDIESFTQSSDDKNIDQIPYLICWNYDDDKIEYAKGENCISSFVNSLLQIKKKIILLYAWYGSGYDFQHVLIELKEKATTSNVIIKNNMIIHATFYFKELDLTIYLKDPYLFLLSSLDRAAKAFNVLNKGSFPHEIIKDWSDLEKVLPNWVSIQRRIVEQKSDDKLGITIKRENIYSYEEKMNNKTIFEKALDYCSVDVLAMKQVWIKFKSLINDLLDIQINEKIFTLSQLSMTLLEATLDKNHILFVPSKDEYDFLKEAIYGGRVYAKNGIYNEEILYADVVSLYPSAMKLLDHPYGTPIEVTERNSSRLGIYQVKLTHISDECPDNYLNFVPRRIDDKLEWSWFKEHTGTYHTYDLLIAESEGYKIEIIKGIEYKFKGKIYDKFIDKLYKMKHDHSICDCDEQPCPIRMIAKIALNGGGYGKFVQRPIEKDIFIVKRDVVAGVFDSLKTNNDGKIMINGIPVNKPSFYNLDSEHYDKMVIEKDENPKYATQQGISILSGSRYRLYCLCKKIPNIDVIYSDTDSLFIRKSTVDPIKFTQLCNSNLGSLDNNIDNSQNNTISNMLICGPKMYAYKFTSKNGHEIEKIYCKGVPKDMLTYSQLLHILTDDRHTLAYNFEILKKKIIKIQTQNITKNVRPT